MSEKVQIQVGNCDAKIIGLSDQAVIDEISRKLSYVQDNARYSPAVKRGQWDGRVRLLSKRLGFPSGLQIEVESVLYNHGIAFDVVDNRGVSAGSSLQWMGPQLRDYQQTMLTRAVESGRGMVKACTGAGKSNVIAALAGHYNTKTVVYVVSLDLLRQMRDTLQSALGVQIGIIGGGECDIQQISVCSVWSAAKAFDEKVKSEEEDVSTDKWSPSDDQKTAIKDMVQTAELLILDEAQFAAAASIQSIMQHSRAASHRFGFSGTPWRSDGADILLTAAFGHNICDIKASDLIALGWLVPPRIAFKDVPPQFSLSKQWPEVKQKYIIENAQRNQILIDGTNKLLDMGRRPLVLFRDIQHGKRLAEMLPADVKYRMVTGELTLDERDQIRDDFTNRRIDLILASSVYDQGVDLPALDALVLASGGKSTAKALQRIGRVIRGAEGKTDALVLETWDQCHFVQRHSRARYSAYRYEQAFKVSAGEAMRKGIAGK